MIAFLAGLFRFFPPKVWAGIGIAIAVVVLFLWWGNVRHSQGIEETDAKWRLASDKLAAQDAKSADAATRKEAPRIDAYAAEVAAEKEKIDEAVSEGRSPFDALFPAG